LLALGDGPGVGKTRIIAAIIQYYMTRHLDRNSRAVWITVSEDLELQINSELRCVGMENSELIHLAEIDNYGREGLLLLTYNGLSYKRKLSHENNMTKLFAFCGQNFDGIVKTIQADRDYSNIFLNLICMLTNVVYR